MGIFQVLNTLLYFCGGVAAWVLNRHCEQALLRGPVKPTVSPVVKPRDDRSKIDPRNNALRVAVGF
ncbi:hypothetical protein [Rickettsia monacensis]|uniref:hypothetical protein n=1 Tax=Rickettsia monacensis TaxID=109232 RepID=UPI0012FDA47F|nr:hypothetical protein [Rickettsia monacensis]